MLFSGDVLPLVVPLEPPFASCAFLALQVLQSQSFLCLPLVSCFCVSLFPNKSVLIGATGSSCISQSSPSMPPSSLYFGSGATGSGANGSGATGSGATGSGATGSGATGSGATGSGATG